VIVNCSIHQCDETEVSGNISWAFKLSSELDLSDRSFYFSAPTESDMKVGGSHFYSYLKMSVRFPPTFTRVISGTVVVLEVALRRNYFTASEKSY